MAKTVSSKRWLKEHFDDQYVHMAKQQGYRSRAVYKLQEIDQKCALFARAKSVLDLGAAPGGWSQYAREKSPQNAKIIASDILKIEPIIGVDFIQGDFREDAVLAQIMQALDGEKCDVILSDMAPNMSGMAADQPRAMYLLELAQALVLDVLAEGGVFVAKLFQGQGSEQYIKELKATFAKVSIQKPKASRPRSREVYVVATGFKGSAL